MRIFNGCIFLANPSSYVRQERASVTQWVAGAVSEYEKKLSKANTKFQRYIV